MVKKAKNKIVASKNRIMSLLLAVVLSFSGLFAINMSVVPAQAFTLEEAGAMAVEDATQEVANRIYSVLKYLGWSDVEIAGAFGNLTQEHSTFDFSTVESVYDENFQWGPKKQAWEAKDYVVSYDPATGRYYRRGLGLIGWTDNIQGGATGNTDLRNYAAANGVEWYETLELQLQYLTDEENGDTYRAHAILNGGSYSNSDYGSFDTTTIEGAMQWWLCYIEGMGRGLWGTSNCAYSARLQFAKEWLTKISTLTYDSTYAAEVLAGNGINASMSGGDWGNPDFTGWDKEENQQMASYSYSMSEWDIFTDDAGFLYDVGAENFITLDVNGWDETVMSNGETISEYCTEEFGGDSEDGANTANFGPLVIAIAYTLNQMGSAEGKTLYGSAFSRQLDDNPEDIAYTKSFLGYPSSASSDEISLKRVYQTLRYRYSQFNNSMTYDSGTSGKALLFSPDEYLKTVVQGVIYGADYVKRGGTTYSTDDAQYYYQHSKSSIPSDITQIQQWYSFADEVMTHYTAVEIEENWIYG